MRRTPRSDRFWKPPTDFDRKPLQQPIADILAGIPRSDWDKPLTALAGNTPREAAKHVNQGCAACRENLREVTQA